MCRKQSHFLPIENAKRLIRFYAKEKRGGQEQSGLEIEHADTRREKSKQHAGENGRQSA